MCDYGDAAGYRRRLLPLRYELHERRSKDDEEQLLLFCRGARTSLFGAVSHIRRLCLATSQRPNHPNRRNRSLICNV